MASTSPATRSPERRTLSAVPRHDGAAPEAAIAQLERKIAELSAEVRRLNAYRELAYRDPLTGLRNRRCFEERLAEEVQRAGRRAHASLAVVAIDVDGLKELNDRDGHAAGDVALRSVGRFLESVVRGQDSCYRVGGDEFALLLPDTGAGGLAGLLARIEARAATDGDLLVGLSLGGATWGAAAGDVEALLAQADAAMYARKRERRGPPVAR